MTQLPCQSPMQHPCVGLHAPGSDYLVKQILAPEKAAIHYLSYSQTLSVYLNVGRSIGNVLSSCVFIHISPFTLSIRTMPISGAIKIALNCNESV